jgi:cytochrome c-type biogenesis protein
VRSFLEPFALGNAAILGNVCMLPLYPGMFVMFAQQSSNPRARRWMPFLGLMVFAGVMVLLVAIGGVFHLLNAAVADVLGVVLPVLYAVVLVLGVVMLFGKNPFARLAVTSTPVVRNPAAGAFLYGTMLAPMTLPCTGPLIISAFTIGSVADAGSFLDSLGYFLAFGLGFGWPLVLLPLLARPAQRSITTFLTRRHREVGIASGVLLLVIATLGIVYDVLPMWRSPS